MLYSWLISGARDIQTGSCPAWAPNETVTGRASGHTSQYNNKEGTARNHTQYIITQRSRPLHQQSTVTTEIWMSIIRFSLIHEDVVFSVFTHPPGFSLHSHFTLRQKSELITPIVWQLLPGAAWSKGSGFSINQSSDWVSKTFGKEKLIFLPGSFENKPFWVTGHGHWT